MKGEEGREGKKERKTRDFPLHFQPGGFMCVNSLGIQ